jgi:hypothetical protein
MKLIDEVLNTPSASSTPEPTGAIPHSTSTQSKALALIAKLNKCLA